MKSHRALTALKFLISLVSGSLLVLACSPPQAEDAPPQPPTSSATTEAEVPATPVLQAATLSHPADWLVARLGGELVSRRLVLPPEDAHAWQPSPEVLIELQEVDLIVASGAGFETWTSQVSLPLSRFVDASHELELIEIVGRTHSHGDSGAHSHGETDPRLFTDPDLYAAQARRIHETLVAASPESQATFDAGLEALLADLAALGADFQSLAEALSERPAAANRDAFNYLFRRLETDLRSFDLDPNESSDKEIQAFKTWAQGQEALLVWEEQPSDEIREALGESVIHVVLDPLVRPGPAGYDYLTAARGNLEALQRVLEVRSADHGD